MEFTLDVCTYSTACSASISWVFWSGAILANTVPCSTSYKAEHTINRAETLGTSGQEKHFCSNVQFCFSELLPSEACLENAPQWCQMISHSWQSGRALEICVRLHGTHPPDWCSLPVKKNSIEHCVLISCVYFTTPQSICQNWLSATFIVIIIILITALIILSLLMQ